MADITMSLAPQYVRNSTGRRNTSALDRIINSITGFFHRVLEGKNKISERDNLIKSLEGNPNYSSVRVESCEVGDCATAMALDSDNGMNRPLPSIYHIKETAQKFERKRARTQFYEEALEELREEDSLFSGLDEKEARDYWVRMTKHYYEQRKSQTPEYRERHAPDLSNLRDLSRVDIVRILKGKKDPKRLEEMLLERGIDPETDINTREMEFAAYYCGVSKRPEALDKDTEINLARRLNFNVNPTTGEKIYAAFYYSNLLQKFYGRKNLGLDKDAPRVEGRVHNNLAEISAFTGIKASTIRYWAKAMERNSAVQRYRVENYGRTFRELSKAQREKIYSYARHNNLTLQQVKEKCKLRSTYVAKRILKETNLPLMLVANTADTRQVA